VSASLFETPGPVRLRPTPVPDAKSGRETAAKAVESKARAKGVRLNGFDGRFLPVLNIDRR
jgi:hypothetical protein